MTGDVERALVERVLSELSAAAVPHDQEAEPELEALRTAIALEDVFGVVLTDAELDPGTLGDAEAVGRLLAGRREVR